MKVSTENSQIRRKSSFTTIWLFIPFINYIFFLMQMRGAYHALRNHFYFRREMPNELTALLIAVKFTFFGILSSGILFMILLAFGVNPFGDVVAYYLHEIAALFGGFFSPEFTAQNLISSANDLQFAGYNVQTLFSLLAVLAITYFIFGLLGSFLSLANLRADLKRNQFLT